VRENSSLKAAVSFVKGGSGFTSSEDMWHYSLLGRRVAIRRTRWREWGVVRGIAIFLTVFSALPVALVYPFVGVLLWAWISFMSPHREAFDFATAFPFNFYAAATTLVAWMLSTEPKALPNQLLPVLVIAFAAFVSLTTYFALEHESAFLLWDMHIKTLALALVVMGLVNTRLRIQAFLWVTALSIGYFAVKGGGFVLLTGSAGSRIFGPANSIISDNNNLSLAMVISLPILNYLRETSSNPYVKLVCWFAIVMTIVAIVGTYSRGGLVGLIVVGLSFLALAKRRRVATLAAAAIIAVGMMNFAPEEWKERMGTTQSYEKDSSATGRIEAWQTSWNLAADRPVLGGGFGAIEQRSTFRKYRPGRKAEHVRAPHSIYFQIIGDHGFVGFFLYVAIIGAATFNLLKVQRQTRDRADLAWANSLSRTLLISFAGFLMAGSFLSMAYYDVFFCMVALSATLRQAVTKEIDGRAAATIEEGDGQGAFVPAWRLASLANGQQRRSD
jgi:putative inorganic carbon (hco3(-)) transporter